MSTTGGRTRRRWVAVGTILAAVLAAGAAHGTPGSTNASVDAGVDLVGAAAGPAKGLSTQTAAWCGEQESGIDRKPDVERAARQIHVLYVIPADGADRFDSVSDAIAGDVAAMDAWWQSQDSTRRPRWDLHAFAECTTRAGMLDIRAIRLPRPATAYLDSEDIDGLIADLVPLVGLDEKALVYYDGPRSEPNICGTSTMAPVNAGRFGFAFLWMGGTCNGDLGSGGSAAVTAIHELVHDLGAVALSGPPHGCQNYDLMGHVCDAPADLMFPYSSGFGLAAVTLDLGRDDYYGHTGTWWDVQDSDWLTRLPLRNLSVTVHSNNGSGTVTSAPALLDCPGTSCSAVADDGVAVKLVANPVAGSRLWSWSGACTGWGACALPAHGDASVTADFGPLRYRTSVSIKGRGRVSSTPSGIDCGARCGSWFAPGTVVRLVAKPATGWRLTGWSGACRGTSLRCDVTASADTVTRATFTRRSR